MKKKEKNEGKEEIVEKEKEGVCGSAATNNMAKNGKTEKTGHTCSNARELVTSAAFASESSGIIAHELERLQKASTLPPVPAGPHVWAVFPHALLHPPPHNDRPITTSMLPGSVMRPPAPPPTELDRTQGSSFNEHLEACQQKGKVQELTPHTDTSRRRGTEEWLSNNLAEGHALLGGGGRARSSPPHKLGHKANTNKEARKAVTKLQKVPL